MAKIRTQPTRRQQEKEEYALWKLRQWTLATGRALEDRELVERYNALLDTLNGMTVWETENIEYRERWTMAKAYNEIAKERGLA
jgi:hypothetical protein